MVLSLIILNAWPHLPTVVVLCILYFPANVPNMARMDLSIQDLLCILMTECYENFNEYMPSFDYDLSSFFHLMYEFVEDKVYGSSFGNLVFRILSNALNEMIVIIDGTDTNVSVTVLPPQTCHSFRGWDPTMGIHLLKVSDHYNACVPVPSWEQHLPSAHAGVCRSRFGTSPMQLASGRSRFDPGASWRALRVNDPATVKHRNVLDSSKPDGMTFHCHDNMMTSSNGNIFRFTGPLCGELTGDRWIPRTKASDAELWCLPWSAPEQTTEETIETTVIWDAIALIMTSL